MLSLPLYQYTLKKAFLCYIVDLITIKLNCMVTSDRGFEIIGHTEYTLATFTIMLKYLGGILFFSPVVRPCKQEVVRRAVELQ